MSSHEYGPELAAEARRIAGAVQDWLDGVAARPSPAAAPEHDRGHEPDPGRGTDAQRGPDCEWCPICRLAAVLRAERPEITERLAEASAAISSALKALIDAATSHLGEHADGSEPESVTDAEPPAAPAPAPGAAAAPAVPGTARHHPVTPAIGVDIGGTKIAGGVVDDDGVVLDRERRDTPGTDPRATETAIVDVVLALAARHPGVGAVGVGAAGWIANDHSTVLFSPHLAWRNEPLRDELTERVGLPLIIENDANAAAWAEYRFGAAQGQSVVVCVTLGTGIGGGLVADGSLYRGAFGIACEYGHTTVVPDGRRCACGNRGCWEMYASGRALARDARELAEESPVAAARMVQLAGSVAGLTGQLVTEAARAGDPAAESICTTMGRWLGRGLANLAAVIDPAVFVIGGGVSAAGELIMRPAREEFAHTLTGRGFRPRAAVELAALGPDAGLVGAADLARRWA